MKTTVVQDLSSFHAFVRDEIIPLVAPKTLFLLSGDLGVGKTELVKTIAEFFKMKDVQSPTFAFHHVYKNEKTVLHHIDLYRLKGEEDLESTGFWDLFENENDTLFVEWSNLIAADAWPWGWRKVFVEIKKNGTESREVCVKIDSL